MQPLSKSQALWTTVFYILIHSGCILLSEHKARGDYLSTPLIWAIPLAAGIVGMLYLITSKGLRATLSYGIPATLIALGLSILVPTTLTRIITLILFIAVVLTIWYQHFKLRPKNT